MLLLFLHRSILKPSQSTITTMFFLQLDTYYILCRDGPSPEHSICVFFIGQIHICKLCAFLRDLSQKDSLKLFQQIQVKNLDSFTAIQFLLHTIVFSLHTTSTSLKIRQPQNSNPSPHLAKKSPLFKKVKPNTWI